MKSLSPAAMLMGTIVGAGIFALPSTAARAGFPLTLAWLVVLSALMLLLHRMFGEVIMRTQTPHRLPGYVRLYLGKRAEWLALTNAFIGGLGVLLIYLVLIEQFLGDLVPLPGDIFVPIAWFALATLIALGIKTIERTELFMSIGIIALVFVLAIIAAPNMQGSNLVARGEFSDALLPFGVLLFALGGFNAIPEMRDFFIGKGKAFGRAITIGTLMPAVLYAVFITVFVGVFGADIGDNLTETVSSLGDMPQMLLMALGTVAVVTSFLVTGAYLVDVLHYDLGVKRRFALLVLAAPLLVYLLGVRQFVPLVALIGTVFASSDGVLLLLTWRSAKKMKSPTSVTLEVRIPKWAFFIVLGLFTVGAVLSLMTQLL